MEVGLEVGTGDGMTTTKTQRLITAVGIVVLAEVDDNDDGSRDG